jgi:hypothetical protein
MLQSTQTNAMKKVKRVFLITAFAITCLFAILYILISPTLEHFVTFGAVDVVCNISLYYLFAFKHRNVSEKNYDRSSVIIISGLTLAIPFSIFYILMVVILRAFKFPFEF